MWSPIVGGGVLLQRRSHGRDPFIFDAVAVEMDGGDGGVLCAYMKTAL